MDYLVTYGEQAKRIAVVLSLIHILLPAEVGGMTLKKQYKYGKVLLWTYGKPRQSAGEGAVSYTHLDVYKRQPQWSKATARWSRAAR